MIWCIIELIDTDGGAILVPLDLSMAFYTIDHDILLQRLHDIGVRDLVLAWSKSYLTDRHQLVYIKRQRPHEHRLTFGAPQ